MFSTATLTVPARAAALGWLNAFLAASTEEDRPVLYRTLSVEWFDDGLQFIATNGHALFRAWVPVQVGAPWPRMDTTPDCRAIVRDTDQFGLAFMRTLLAVTNGDEGIAVECTVALEYADELPALGEDLSRKRLIITAAGQRLELNVYEAEYPNWRALRLGIDDVVRVDGLVIGPKMFQMVGKLKGVNRVALDFHGVTRAVAFEATGESDVRGFIMPMRDDEHTEDEGEAPKKKEKKADPAVLDALADLAPQPGSGLESVTVSVGRESVTLTQEDGKRIHEFVRKERGG